MQVLSFIKGEIVNLHLDEDIALIDEKPKLWNPEFGKVLPNLPQKTHSKPLIIEAASNQFGWAFGPGLVDPIYY